MNKETLRAFRNQSKEARQLLEQLQTMEARMYAPKAQQLTAMPRGGGGGRSIDDLTAAHIALQDRYRAALADIERQQLEIEKAITVLEPAERMVIRYRYMDMLGWEDVADRMRYGWSQTHRIHAAALRALEAAEK